MLLLSVTLPASYFLPDRSRMQKLYRAVECLAKVRAPVPGRQSDRRITRSTRRGGYGRLLHWGAAVYEYLLAMIHAKILIADRLWPVVGSTNRVSLEDWHHRGVTERATKLIGSLFERQK